MCTAFNYNFTRKTAERNPVEVVIIRAAGICIGSLIFAFLFGESIPDLAVIGLVAGYGFVFSGIFTLLIIYAQRYLGASKTATIIGIAPLISAFLSFVLLGEALTMMYLFGLLLIIPGMYFTIFPSRREKNTETTTIQE